MTLPRLAPVAAAGPALLLSSAPPALAASGERTPLNLDPVGHAHASAGGGSLVRTFVGLAVVLAVIYGVYWVLKQVRASREERSSGFGLESIATLPLGTGRSLHMVRAGSEVVLIGVGEHGVTPIRTYAEAEARDAGLLAAIEDDAEGWPDLRVEGAAPLAANGAGPGARPTAPPTVGQFVRTLRRRTVRR